MGLIKKSKDNKDIILGIAIIAIISLAVGFIALSKASSISIPSCPTSPSSPCLISFDGVKGVGNAQTSSNSISLTVTVPTKGDIMIVSEASTLPTKAISDTQNNVFTTILNVSIPNVLQSAFAAFTFPKLVSSDTITVTTNTTQVDETINIIFYKNVFGIGAITSTSNVLSGASISLSTIKSGSWIVGMTNIPTLNNLPIIVSSTGFVQRIDTVPPSNAGPELDNEDTNSSFLDRQTVTFSPTWNNGQVAILFEFEIIALFNTPTGPSNCITSGDSCHVNTALKTSGANALNQALHGNTIYCTGITTSGLIVSASALNVILLGQWSGLDRNQTTQSVLVTLKIGTTAPSTVFGSGVCSSSNSGGATSVVANFAAINQAASPAFQFSTTLPSAGTYFGWIEIKPTTTNVSMDSYGTNGGANALGSSITLLQLK